MKDVSLGTDLVGPERLPRVAVSHLLRSYAGNVSTWMRAVDGAPLVDLSAPPPGALRVRSVARQDTVIAGGTFSDDDLAAARDATRDLSAALAERLDALGIAAGGARAREARAPLEMEVRRGRAAFQSLGDTPRARALVVLSTREEFPDRQALCGALEEAMRGIFDPEDAARFSEHLPWRDEPYATLRSAPQRQMDRFLRFLQEYGMARVRLRTALAWMETQCRAIPDADPQQRVGVGYVAALATILRAAEDGQLPEEVAVGDLGMIRPLTWANVDFVSKLPLVPRADCEVAENEDEGDSRRGLDVTRTRERPSGRRTSVLLRHVTWLPRFHASGPGLVAGRGYATTLYSRALFLEDALRDGRFVCEKPTREGERLRMLRALEQHLVVRAAMRAALGRSPDPLRELREALDWLQDPKRMEKAARRVVEGFLVGTSREPALEASLEDLAAAFATHAGRFVRSSKVLDFTVTLDDDLFEAGAQSPLRPGRPAGRPASEPDWAWMRRLRVRDGDVLTSSRFTFGVRVVLDPLALAWSDEPAPLLATRGGDDPLTVVLAHAQPAEAGSSLERLVRDTLKVEGAAAFVLLPRLGPAGTPYKPDDGSPESASIHRASGAVLVGAEALRMILRRVDAEGRRAVRFLSVFDRGLEDDQLDDAGLKAMARALEATVAARPVYAQGICHDLATEHTLEAGYRLRGTRASLDQHGFLTLARPAGGEDGAIGILVMAGRPVDCARARSGRPVHDDAGNDLLWGDVYLARSEGSEVTIASRGRLGAVLRREHDWPGAVTEALADLREQGCSHVVLVTHRAFERSTWRTESRNRLYDGEVPLALLAGQPVCEGMTLVSMLCDTVTGISADPSVGVRPSEARLLVADGEGLHGAELLGGALRPFVAVATNRSPFFQLEKAPNGRRRIGLRRRIHVYLERGGERPWLSGAARERVREALVGLHLLEAENLSVGRRGARPVLAPVLLPHRVFHVDRRCDAGELLWRKDHRAVWLNLVALGAAGQRLVRGGSDAR